MNIIYLLLIYIPILVWDMFLYFNHSVENLSNYYFNLGYSLMYFYCGGLALIISKKEKSALTDGVGLIGYALLSYGIGTAVWGIYNIFLKIEVPFPSLADLFFLIFTILIFFGLLKIMSVYKQSINLSLILQMSLIIIIAFIGSVFLISTPDLSSQSGLLPHFLNIFYPTSDAVLIALSYALIKLSTGGKIQSVFLTFAVATICQVTADYLFSYQTTNNTYWNGSISDLLFATSPFIFGIGIIKIKEILFT